MSRKIWIIVISVILILLFSVSALAKEILFAKIELKDGSIVIGETEKLTISVKTKDGIEEIDIEDIVYLQMNIISSLSLETVDISVWRLQSPWYIITGVNAPKDYQKFYDAIEKSLGEKGSLLGGYSGDSLVERAERYLESIKRSNIIFLISPKAKEFEALKELWKKYPELFPLSCDKLNELRHLSPLIYLTYNIQAGKLRGVVVADEVDSSLAKLLAEEELPLNTLLQYEDGRLKEVKEK